LKSITSFVKRIFAFIYTKKRTRKSAPAKVFKSNIGSATAAGTFKHICLKVAADKRLSFLKCNSVMHVDTTNLIADFDNVDHIALEIAPANRLISHQLCVMIAILLINFMRI